MGFRNIQQKLENRNFTTLLTLKSRSPMVTSQTSHYGAFREEDDPNYLGVARERSNWLAKIFLYWVNPLILKGRRDQIKSTDDVFDVPPKLRLLEAIGLKLKLIYINLD